MPFNRSCWIRPTRRGWVALLLTIALLLVAMVNISYYELLLFWGGCSLLVISYLSLLFFSPKIEIKRIAMMQAMVGREFSSHLEITNKSRWRSQPFLLREALPFLAEHCWEDGIPGIPSHQTMLVQRSLLPLKRGEYSLDRLEVIWTDPVGFFIRKRSLSVPKVLVVYPRVTPIDCGEISAQELLLSQKSHSNLVGPEGDYLGIREYTMQDEIRQIHWKNSAKFRKLMVKEQERTSDNSVVAALDISHIDSPFLELRFEQWIVQVASLCHFCKEKHYLFTLMMEGRVLGPADARELYEEVMYRLALVTPLKGEDEQWPELQRRLQQLPLGTTLAVFSETAEQEMGKENLKP